MLTIETHAILDNVTTRKTATVIEALSDTLYKLRVDYSDVEHDAYIKDVTIDEKVDILLNGLTLKAYEYLTGLGIKTLELTNIELYNLLQTLFEMNNLTESIFVSYLETFGSLESNTSKLLAFIEASGSAIDTDKIDEVGDAFVDLLEDNIDTFTKTLKIHDRINLNVKIDGLPELLLDMNPKTFMTTNILPLLTLYKDIVNIDDIPNSAALAYFLLLANDTHENPIDAYIDMIEPSIDGLIVDRVSKEVIDIINKVVGDE